MWPQYILKRSLNHSQRADSPAVGPGLAEVHTAIPTGCTEHFRKAHIFIQNLWRGTRSPLLKEWNSSMSSLGSVTLQLPEESPLSIIPKVHLASPGARVPWYNCLKTAPLEIQNSLENLKSSSIKELVLLVQQSMFQVSLTTELFGILIPISTAFRKYLRRLWVEHIGPFNGKKKDIFIFTHT